MTPLIERARALYAQCKDGSAPGAMIAMIDLRNTVPELLDRLEALEKDRANWVEIDRLTLGRPDLGAPRP